MDNSTHKITQKGNRLRYVYVVDGSRPKIDTDEFAPGYKDEIRQYRACFVSTLILRLDLDYKIGVATQARKEITQNGKVTKYKTILPVRHVSRKGYDKVPFDTLRLEVFEAISRAPEIMETYKWLVYRKWNGL